MARNRRAAVHVSLAAVATTRALANRKLVVGRVGGIGPARSRASPSARDRAHDMRAAVLFDDRGDACAFLPERHAAQRAGKGKVAAVLLQRALARAWPASARLPSQGRSRPAWRRPTIASAIGNATAWRPAAHQDHAGIFEAAADPAGRLGRHHPGQPRLLHGRPGRGKIAVQAGKRLVRRFGEKGAMFAHGGRPRAGIAKSPSSCPLRRTAASVCRWPRRLRYRDVWSLRLSGEAKRSSSAMIAPAGSPSEDSEGGSGSSPSSAAIRVLRARATRLFTVPTAQ